MALYITIIILGIALLTVSLRYMLLCRELKHTQKQLREIAQDLGQNRILRQQTRQKETEPLLEEINRILKNIREQRAEDYKKEREFQKQIAQISHDLRTPLTSMIGYLRLMDQSSLSREEREDIAVVERKAQALQRLITQFYDYSKARDEDLKLELKETDAARLLREKVLDSWREMEERKLDVELELPEEAVFVMADKDALERVFANLLQNCGRYAKTKLRIELRKDEQHVVILFANDTSDFAGKQMQTETIPSAGQTTEAVQNGRKQTVQNELEKLFERFYVRDSARTQGASGLGLSIARGLTEKMGGTLTAEMQRPGWLQFVLVLRR